MSVTRNARTGSFEVRWREHGRQWSKSFKNRADAEELDEQNARRLRRQAAGLPKLDAGRQTLAEFIKDTWGPERFVSLSVRSAQTYSGHLRHILHDSFGLGDVELGDLDEHRIRAWRESRLESGVKPSVTSSALTLLSSILKLAWEREEIDNNPAARVLSVQHPRQIAQAPRWLRSGSISIPTRIRDRRADNGGLSIARPAGRRSWTPAERRGIHGMTGGHCHLCGDPVDYGAFHIDHVVPLSQGGDDDLTNVLPAHPECNLRKHDGMPITQRLGVLATTGGNVSP